MTDKTKRPKKREVDDLRSWLTNLDMVTPTLHVNGAAYTMAVIVVDFGTPLVEQKLESEQSAELTTRMRAVTKSLLHEDWTVRVQNDTTNGIWWTSLG